MWDPGVGAIPSPLHVLRVEVCVDTLGCREAQYPTMESIGSLGSITLVPYCLYSLFCDIGPVLWPKSRIFDWLLHQKPAGYQQDVRQASKA